jgi:crotonobetainyl-CoA:carnitine CoA-transferase CaiB-like acyl-CoA transferase
MYGMMHITGQEGGSPVKPGVAVTDVLTGEILFTFLLPFQTP